jgi:hypothetical protein
VSAVIQKSIPTPQLRKIGSDALERNKKLG